MNSLPDSVTEIYDPMVLRARARIGTTLRDKWRLDVLLGVGGMACVYAATHRNGSRAAVKILHTELSINPQVKTRFLREGYVANAVGHEGAVKVIDDDTDSDGSLYLVTELLDGETLEERRLRFGGRLSEDDVLAMTDQLLDVLATAHAKGVVHRDLKNENVFVTRTGQVKVLDFGIARLRELSTASTATRAGSTMGTPSWMPPEQARGLWDEVDGRSDLWAVGATMFSLLTGRLVHEERTTNEVLLAAMTKQAPQVRSVLPCVSVAVARVVDRALAFEKSARWADAKAMQEAVRHAYHDRHGAPISTAPRLTVPEGVPNRTLPSADGASALPVRQPTTGQPVASGRSGAASVASAPNVRLAFAIGGAVFVVVLVVGAIGTAVAIGRFSGSLAALASTAVASSVLAAAPSASPAATPAPVGSGPPPIAATDLPAGSSSKLPSGTKPTATARGPVPPAQTNCKPPFTVDEKGRHIPKPECG